VVDVAPRLREGEMVLVWEVLILMVACKGVSCAIDVMHESCLQVRHDSILVEGDEWSFAVYNCG
jgi:hypothetical protein